ncbi:hypothetical protein OR16_39904 [Cupriavidus basilensis OR16]|uniref:Polysaccharide biosynthesis protein n=1 Tax=Cupriavidus basilensis OR16 TaxID=1127483 RepID=H1SHN8_9BURK|nr:oligosaccharide flippase family protein [Cupriavidus basilensis]EHP37946.1 hypothetical protein OR16_39904 [Cupriavidus basilensis OR16]
MKIRKSASLVVLLSSIVSSGLGFLFQIAVSRSLSQHEYAQYTIFFEIYTTIVMVCDLGMAVTFVNLFRQKLTSEDDSSREERLLILVVIALKAAIFFPSFVIGSIYFYRISPGVYGVTELFLYAALFCSVTEVAYQFCLTVDQSHTDFMRLAVFRIILPIARVLAIFALIYFGNRDFGLISLIYGISAIVCIPKFIRLIVEAKLSIIDMNELKPYFREFFSLLKWNLLASFSALVVMKADVLIVASYLPPSEIAAYGAAQRFSIVGSVLTGACGTVLIPLAVGLKHRIDIDRYLKKAIRNSILFALPLAVLILMSKIIVPMVMGPNLASVCIWCHALVWRQPLA